MKIDRDTFEFQMRLVKAEIKIETLTEENERLKGWGETQRRHIDSLLQSEQHLRDELKAANTYIDRFIKRSVLPDPLDGMPCCENGRFGDGHKCRKQPGHTATRDSNHREEV